MRVLVLCLLVVMSGRTLASGQVVDRAPDDTAVRDLVARYVAARELRDPEEVASLFTADADQYTTSGEWRRGRNEIAAGTSRSSAQNPGARVIRVDAVRFVTSDVAIADGPYEIHPGNGAPVRRMWTSFVVVRLADGWRIAAIRNMAPTRPMP